MLARALMCLERAQVMYLDFESCRVASPGLLNFIRHVDVGRLCKVLSMIMEVLVICVQATSLRRTVHAALHACMNANEHVHEQGPKANHLDSFPNSFPPSRF